MLWPPMSNPASWAVSAANKFREVVEDVSDPRLVEPQRLVDFVYQDGSDAVLQHADQHGRR
ncbi:MAG: hypothetical protein QOK33_4634 [Mycobacterium sp.]|nr:hypothetical protein [Mycobacterium sp.]